MERCYESIQQALDALTKKSTGGWSEIKVGKGHYYEKLVIDLDRLKIVGEDRDSTKIYFDAVAETASKYHRDGWGTAGSATLTIQSRDVEIHNITIENSFDYLANDALPNGHKSKVANSQAVAVLLDVKSDRVRFQDVALLGYQDTLFADGYRAHIVDSTIAGNVDFIFGRGFLVIEQSDVQSQPRGAEMSENSVHSYITAPSTSLQQPYGIVFLQSRLTRDATIPDQSVTLARPWHPTTIFKDGRYADPDAVGFVAYIDCYMDGHIHKTRWSSMKGTARDGTKTAVFRPEDSRFYESGSYGAGAHSSLRSHDLKKELFLPRMMNQFYQGWSNGSIQ